MAVDLGVLTQSLPGLELELAKAERNRADLQSYVENNMHQQTDAGDDEIAELDRDALKYNLGRVSVFLLQVYEAAGFFLRRQEFLGGWQKLHDLRDTNWNGAVDYLSSEALEYMTNEIDGLRVLVAQGRSPLALANEARLRDTLEATAHFLLKRGVSPTKEKDVQDVMDDVLAACFLGDYVKNPQIPGFVKNFNADGGVKSLDAAIEFKFVTSETELKQAVSGVIEDTAGYKGSKDWTKFYSVIYQTASFAAAAHLKAEIRRVGAIHWTPILVGGNGGKIGKTKSPA